MATLQETVRTVIKEYAVDGANFKSYLTANHDEDLFTVVDIARDQDNRRFTATSIVLEILENLIVIVHDDNNKPLVDALVQAGIPRSQIILAYEGETVPEAAQVP
jgi:hypothetical protein